MKTYPIGRVYQIINDVDDLKYVGSTSETLSRRMVNHRFKGSSPYPADEPLYQHMQNIGVSHFAILLLEQTGPITKEALRALENKYMIAMDTVNNGLNGHYESRICIHNKKRYTCKDCGGVSICEHQRERNKCKDCGGASICEHQRQRSQCKDCGGASICEHQHQRSRCKECGGNSLCEHQRRPDRCKECNLCELCDAANTPSHQKTVKHIRIKAMQTQPVGNGIEIVLSLDSVNIDMLETQSPAM